MLCANSISIFDVSHIKFCTCAVNLFSTRDLVSKGTALHSRQRHVKVDVKSKKGIAGYVGASEEHDHHSDQDFLVAAAQN